MALADSLCNEKRVREQHRLEIRSGQNVFPNGPSHARVELGKPVVCTKAVVVECKTAARCDQAAIVLEVRKNLLVRVVAVDEDERGNGRP